MQAGIIGLGAMGSGMARNMACSDYLTTLWNRTPDKAEKLAVELGLKASTSIQQLAADVDIIVICVSADKDLLEVIKKTVKYLEEGNDIQCNSVAYHEMLDAMAKAKGKPCS